MNSIHGYMYATFGLGIISQIILVQNLSAYDYGIFTIIVMVSSLLQMPINLHSGEVFLRYSKPKMAPLMLRKKLNLIEIKLFFAGSLVLIIIIHFVYNLVFQNVITYFVLLLFLPCQYSFAVNKVMFTVSDEMEKLSKVELIFGLIKLSIYSIFAIYTNLESLILGHLVFLSVKTLMIRYTSRSLSLTFTNERVVLNKKYSLTAFFRSFLQQTSSNIDIIVVSFMFKLETVALYKVAKVVCQSIFVSQQPIWRVLQPKLYQSFKQKDKSNQFINLINQGIIQSICFFLPVYISLSLVGDQIIYFLYGSEYESAIDIIMILLFAILFYNIFVGWFKVWSINTEKLILPLVTYSIIITLYFIFPYFLNIIDVISLTYLFTFVNLVVFIFIYFYIS